MFFVGIILTAIVAPASGLVLSGAAVPAYHEHEDEKNGKHLRGHTSGRRDQESRRMKGRELVLNSEIMSIVVPDIKESKVKVADTFAVFMLETSLTEANRAKSFDDVRQRTVV
uniref:Uncharacterized protein n=1 Tax=Peronospora matthiolae TaxID=2874970 RepID=A0AAV1TW47_9STRA